jgi:hypothetical protein
VIHSSISPNLSFVETFPVCNTFFNVAGYSSIQEINAYITALQSRLRFIPDKEAKQVRNMLRLTLDMI